MRLSEFAKKRILDISSGEILGSAGDCDLLIDPKDGKIVEIQLQEASGIWNRGERHSIVIPWSAVQKVGSEVIVVDLDPDRSHR